MITITIDDKACVNCSLCVDACPTRVFDFDQASELPTVAHPKECFGCLSCSEICPASAIHHEGAIRTETFYHDPYALEMVKKFAVAEPLHYQSIDGAAERDAAMSDLSLRLLSVGAVLKEIVGGGLASVGLMAGRSLATQLPRYRPPRNLDEALALAKLEFSPAWELDFEKTDDQTLSVKVGKCFVRELCAKENLALGGELCVLFFHYLSGYLGKMGKTQLKLAEANRGQDGCCYQVRITR